MSYPLLPDISDLIVDHLHDEPTTLKACCTISKSWVPRARRHLFARVEFYTHQSRFESWMKTFPDPSNSPAHHVRILMMVIGTPLTTAASPWIRAFHNVVSFHVDFSSTHSVSLVPFHGFSPSLRSLHLGASFLPLSAAINLLCSFSLLEDLAIRPFHSEAADRWTVPSTSPRLTGSLDLRNLEEGICFTARRLLELPNGLHFTKIELACLNEADFKSAADLVSRCSGTLESLIVVDHSPGVFPSAPVSDAYLMAMLRV